MVIELDPATNDGPPPPPKDKIHRVTLGYNPKTNTANMNSTMDLIHEKCIAIYEKTGYKAIFYPTIDIQPQPKPITNIKMNSLTTIPKLKDFLKVDQFQSKLQVKIHLAFTMPGMTEQSLQKSMKNTLQQENLWLNSNKIAASRYDDMGFVKKSNLEYMYIHKVTTKIVQAIIKEAEENPTTAEQLALIKGDNLIWCVSKKIYRMKVIGETIVI